MNIEIVDLKVLVAFWLAFSRCLAVIFQLPLFDGMKIPSIVKAMTTLMITYAFFPHIEGEILKDIAYVGVENFWILTIFYTGTGLIIGFFVKSIMNMFIAAGSIITQQVGFGAVRYFDPQSGSQVGPFETLIQWTMLIIIVTSGALLPMFKGVFNSFHSVHIYDLGKLAYSTTFFTTMFKNIFLSALMLASPFIFTNLLIMSVLGIIARTVPQMNIIMVSFVVNIGLGLLIFAASSEEFFRVGFRVYTEQLGHWFQVLI